MEIHYKKSGEFIFFCVSSRETKKRLCWAFIDDLESSFVAVTKKKDPSANKKLIRTKIVCCFYFGMVLTIGKLNDGWLVTNRISGMMKTLTRLLSFKTNWRQ